MKKRFVKICGLLTESCLLAIVFLTPVVFDFFEKNINIFELDKQIIFRLLLIAALIFFTAKIFIEGKLDYRVDSKIFFLAAFILLPLVITTIFSFHPQLSLWGDYTRQQGLGSFINYLLFFFLLVFYLHDRRRVRKIIIAAVLSSVFVCAYGLAQYFVLDPIDWKEKALATGRIFSTLGQPNFFGQYLIMVLPLTAFSLIFVARRFIGRCLIAALMIIQLTCLIFTYSRAAWLGLAAGIGVFVFLFLFLGGYKKWTWGLLITFLAGVFVVAVLNSNYSPPVYLDEKIGNMTARARSIFDLNAGSNKIRIYYWQAAWREFKEAPWQRKLIGFGPETQASVFVKYYRPDWGVYETINSFPDRAHNTIFDTWLQFGLVGLFLAFLFPCFLVSRTLKYLTNSAPASPVDDGGTGRIFPSPPKEEIQSPIGDWISGGVKKGSEYWLAAVLLSVLAAYFVNNLFSFSLTVGYVYLCIILAFLMFAISGKEELKSIDLRWFSGFSRALIWLFLLLTGVVFIYYYNINFYRADHYYLKVKKAEIKSDCRGVLDNLERMVSLNPISTLYRERYMYYGLNCFGAINSKDDQFILRDNIVTQINSISRREYKFSTRVNIAHAKSLFGFYIDPKYYADAEKDYEYLLSVNPYITTAYNDLGRLKLWQKDYDGAIAIFKKGIEALPPLDHPYLNNDHRREIENELASFYEMLGMVYALKKEWQSALDYYRKVLRLNPRYLHIYKKIADVYYEQGDWDKAIWYNKRGLMLNPSDYNWHFGLAMLYREKGEKEKALAYAEAALKLAPDNEKVKEFTENIK